MQFQALNKKSSERPFTVLRTLSTMLVCGLLSVNCDGGGPSCPSGPVVSAGPDQLDRPVGATISLEASIHDSDGEFVADWEFLSVPDGSAFAVGSANFTGAHNSLPGSVGGDRIFPASFVCDVSGEYLLELHGSGGCGEDTDQILVSCTDTVNSQAVCGDEVTVTLGLDATLDGANSAVLAGQEIEYAWSLVSKPTESTLTDELPAVAQPSFSPDVIGEYEAQLRVRGDSEEFSAPCSTLVQVVLEAPSARITSSDTSVSTCTAGTSFDLSAETSTSPGDQVLSYQWTLIQKPIGSLADDTSFGTPSAETTTFTPDLFGNYEVGLQVSSVGGTSLIATQVLDALEGGAPPVVAAGQDQAIDIDVACFTSDLGMPVCDPCLGPFALPGVVTSDDNDAIAINWIGEGIATDATFFPLNAAQVTASILPRYPAANGDPIVYTLPLTLQASDCGNAVEDTMNIVLTCTGSFVLTD